VVELDEAVHSAHRGGRDAVPVSLPAVDGPEEAVLAAEQRAEVADAFRRLRSDQQEVLALRVLGGLSAAQVGEVLGKSEGAVRVAQHRALRSLREAMGVTAG
jgi:RNA polymerase sigma-70 factor (ECF subfamily)